MKWKNHYRSDLSYFFTRSEKVPPHNDPPSNVLLSTNYFFKKINLIVRGLLMFLKNCPVCDSRKIRRVDGMVERKIQRKIIRVPEVTYWLCEHCGEKIFFPESLRQMRSYVEQHSETKSHRILKNAKR